MNRLVSITTIGCLFLLCSSSGLHAKPDTTYWGPDTTLQPPTVSSFGDLLDHLYDNVASHHSTNILTDRVGNFSTKESFPLTLKGNGGNEATISDFYQIYTEMTESYSPYTQQPSMIELNSLALELGEESNTIPLGLMRYRYNTISQDAKDFGGVYWDRYELKATTNNVGYERFPEAEVQLLMPMTQEAQLDVNGTVTFVFDSRFMFTNLANHDPVSIKIDFDDDLGLREVSIDAPINVTYSTGGIKHLAYEIEYPNDEWTEGYSSFSARGAHPTYNYGCGEGTLIYNGLSMRDEPDEIVPIAALQVIPNSDNKSGLSQGDIGIYYGCGNTNCEIQKPIIFVSGFGPDPFVSPKKTLDADNASQMFYNHMNGILGHSADDKDDHGVNNGTNLLYKLRNEGYDVIIVAFDNGVDYLQNHASLVKAVIAYVNGRKAMNGSKHENVIVGQSMGGISTRYALAYWEKEFMQPNSSPYIHHQCRLWISWEGEMQGATIPMGLQMNTWYLINRMPMAALMTVFGGGVILGGAASFILNLGILHETLNTVGAKSLLTYHFTDNMANNNPTLYKNTLHVQLQSELAILGYPDAPRKVAIADGSSTVERPEDVNLIGGDCVLDFNFGWVNHTGAYWGRMWQRTEKVGQDQEVFRGRWRWMGIPVPGFHKTIVKNYPKAESIAPGAFEQFYKGYMLPIAKLSILNSGTCALDDYRAPFVPTTTVFDIQDDNSNDFSYACSDRLFFRKFNEHDNDNLYGYPHNNPALANPKSVTPFDACMATPANEVHLQNPPLAIADFILLETTPPKLYLQNRTISGHSAQHVYSARFEARELIEAGDDVTETTPSANFVLEAHTDVEIEAPIVRLAPGFRALPGSHVSVVSSDDPLPTPCFEFISATSANKRSPEHSSERSSRLLQSVVNPTQYANYEERVTMGVFPNPNNGSFSVQVSKDMVGAELSIFDVTGSLIHNVIVTDVTTDFNLSSVPHVSILILTQDDQTLTYKMITQ